MQWWRSVTIKIKSLVGWLSLIAQRQQLAKECQTHGDKVSYRISSGNGGSIPQTTREPVAGIKSLPFPEKLGCTCCHKWIIISLLHSSFINTCFNISSFNLVSFLFSEVCSLQANFIDIIFIFIMISFLSMQ